MDEHRKENISQFRQYVCALINNRFPCEGASLPPQFKQCDDWASKYEYEHTLTPEKDPKHYDCRNCTDGLVFVGHTPESFYDTYSDKWDAVFPTPKALQLTKYSTARQASDDESVMMALPNRWDGVTLSDVDESSLLADNILFFYREIKQVDKTEFEGRVQDHRAAKRKQQLAKHALNEQRIATERKVFLDKLIQVFSEK